MARNRHTSSRRYNSPKSSAVSVAAMSNRRNAKPSHGASGPGCGGRGHSDRCPWTAHRDCSPMPGTPPRSRRARCWRGLFAAMRRPLTRETLPRGLSRQQIGGSSGTPVRTPAAVGGYKIGRSSSLPSASRSATVGGRRDPHTTQTVPCRGTTIRRRPFMSSVATSAATCNVA